MRHLLMIAALVSLAACSRPAGRPAAGAADTAAQAAPPPAADTAQAMRDTTAQRPDTTPQDR